MKAVICGDAHFGVVHGLGKNKPDGGNTRYDDYSNFLKEVKVIFDNVILSDEGKKIQV